jgi:hypothetical protein
MPHSPHAFAEAWQRSWTGPGAQAGTAPGTVVVLAETPAYPLARTVPMPAGTGYPTGALGFRLLGLTARGLDQVDPDRCRIADRGGEEKALHLVLPAARITGTCSVDAKHDPVVTVDAGGSMGDLPEAPLPAGSDDPPASPLDEEKEAWLENARKQEERLGQTDNGKALLEAYRAHNDTYAELFQTSAAMRGTWKAGGVTRRMARDTHTRVNSGEPVNTGTYNGLSYNAHAFQQQSALAIACNTVAKDANTRDPERWHAAGQAAGTFAEHVKLTGNSQYSAVPMSREEVYATVVTADPASVPPPGPAADGLDPQPGAGAAGPGTGGAVLDEPDRARLQALADAIRRERAENAAITGTPLFTGACGADLAGVEVAVAYRVERGEVKVLGTEVTLPAFAFEIDDSGWTGTAGVLARTRIESLRFLHGVVHDAIADGIRRAVAPRAAAVVAALAAA